MTTTLISKECGGGNERDGQAQSKERDDRFQDLRTESTAGEKHNQGRERCQVNIAFLIH